MSSGPDEYRHAAEPSRAEPGFVDDVTSEIPIGALGEPRHADDWGRYHDRWVPAAQLALERFETRTPTVADQPVGELHSTEWLTGSSGAAPEPPAAAEPAEDVAGEDVEEVPFLTGLQARTPRTPPTPYTRRPEPAPPVSHHPSPRFATPEDRFVTRPHAGALYLTNNHPDAVPTTPTGFRGVDIGGPAVEEPSGASAVRPYMWTRGRTRSGLDLAIEALVSTSMQGRNQIGLLQVEHRTVAELCEQVRSVAEVAALLSLPLGVARVLLGDMAGLGVITVHQTASSSGSSPDLALMERVLSGLRRL